MSLIACPSVIFFNMIDTVCMKVYLGVYLFADSICLSMYVSPNVYTGFVEVLIVKYYLIKHQ